MAKEEKVVDSNIIWQDKKRPFFGLPLSFTTYTLYKDRLYTTVKFLSVHEDEVRLYRIFDITLTIKLVNEDSIMGQKRPKIHLIN